MQRVLDQTVKAGGDKAGDVQAFGQWIKAHHGVVAVFGQAVEVVLVCPAAAIDGIVIVAAKQRVVLTAAIQQIQPAKAVQHKDTVIGSQNIILQGSDRSGVLRCAPKFDEGR